MLSMTKSSDNFKNKWTNYHWRAKGMLKRPSDKRYTKERKGRVDDDMGIMRGEWTDKTLQPDNPPWSKCHWMIRMGDDDDDNNDDEMQVQVHARACVYVLIPVATWPKAQVWAAYLLGLWVPIPLGACISVCCEYRVLSGRGLCVRLITHPEKPYRVWCFWEWSWSNENEEAWPTRGCCAMEKIKWMRERERERESVSEWVSECVCVCVWERERERVCVCVCVWERERERRKLQEWHSVWDTDNIQVYEVPLIGPLL